MSVQSGSDMKVFGHVKVVGPKKIENTSRVVGSIPYWNALGFSYSVLVNSLTRN